MSIPKSKQNVSDAEDRLETAVLKGEFVSKFEGNSKHIGDKCTLMTAIESLDLSMNDFPTCELLEKPTQWSIMVNKACYIGSEISKGPSFFGVAEDSLNLQHETKKKQINYTTREYPVNVEKSSIQVGI